MGLKATGCYLSRALSYRGADFALAPVPIDIVFRCRPSFLTLRLEERRKVSASSFQQHASLAAYTLLAT